MTHNQENYKNGLKHSNI